MKYILTTTPLLLAILSPSVLADSLSEVYNLAKQNDPQLIQAAAERESAFESINSTRSALLPQIDLTAGYQYQDSDRHTSDGSSTNVNLGLSQSIYDRSSWIALDISEMSARESDAQYAATQQAVIYKVTEAYFDVLKAEDNLGFIKAEKAAVAKQLKQTEERFDVGIAPITDVQDAKAQYDNVLAQEIQAQNSVENEYENLRAITGVRPDKLAILNTQMFSASEPKETPEMLVAKATSENLEILADRIQKDIAKQQISLAQSDHLPTISLTSDYNYSKNYNEPNNPLTGQQMDDDENQFNLASPSHCPFIPAVASLLKANKRSINSSLPARHWSQPTEACNKMFVPITTIFALPSVQLRPIHNQWFPLNPRYQQQRKDFKLALEPSLMC